MKFARDLWKNLDPVFFIALDVYLAITLFRNSFKLLVLVIMISFERNGPF